MSVILDIWRHHVYFALPQRVFAGNRFILSVKPATAHQVTRKLDDILARGHLVLGGTRGGNPKEMVRQAEDAAARRVPEDIEFQLNGIGQL